jgi:hypothetical protein
MTTTRNAREFREIAQSDVGKGLFYAFGRTWMTSGFIGRILPGDVGKRVYLNGDELQVENDEQRAKRLARGGLVRHDVRHEVALVDSAAMRSWHMMYLGAFVALRIDNVEMAQELALTTFADEEVTRAIAMMRDGKPGDRVYPALEWLREQRAKAKR